MYIYGDIQRNVLDHVIQDTVCFQIHRDINGICTDAIPKYDYVFHGEFGLFREKMFSDNTCKHNLIFYGTYVRLIY